MAFTNCTSSNSGVLTSCMRNRQAVHFAQVALLQVLIVAIGGKQGLAALIILIEVAPLWPVRRCGQ